MFKSFRKLQANRANAQKSTGPTSAAGKEKVSQNRTTHGLLGQFRVLPGEHQDRFDALLDQLIDDENPLGIAEIELVKKMAESMWLAQRARRYQEACFVVKPQTGDQLAGNQAEIAVRPELERYLRYQAHHDRAYARASAELLKRRKERRLAEIGFESQKRAEADEKRRAAAEERKTESHQIAIARAAARLRRLTPPSENGFESSNSQTTAAEAPNGCAEASLTQSEAA